VEEPRPGGSPVYARDDRPWAGPDPPAAVYFYSPDRKAVRPASHLEGFRGVLQVDGYAGFETLAAKGDIVLAACWAHARRKFYEFHQATGSPIAAEALRRIAELYAIEKRIRGQPAEARQRARQAESRPLIEAMKSLSLDIIVFSEIHSAALRCLSLQRSRFWSHGTSERQGTLGARL
jgi:hypothetical protein